MRSHQEVHEIMSITQGATMRFHQEVHGITSNSHHSHVSPTNHRFIMHINLMPISNQPTNHDSCVHLYQAHQFPVHTIIYYMHIHILHTLNRILQSIIQPTTKKWKRTAIEQVPTLVSLKPWTLLRRKELFAQATGHRLGEIANKEHCRFHEFSLGQDLLSWARLLFAWAKNEAKHNRLPRVLA